MRKEQGTPGKNKISEKAKDVLAELDSLGRVYKPKIGRYGGNLHLPLDHDPDGFSPATSRSVYSSFVMGFIYEGLVTLDMATLEYKPFIAEKWNRSDDGMVWDFYLRDDVHFFDGVKVTAYDVEFTFNELIYNEKVRSGLNYNFRVKGEIIKVTAVDSFHVRFELPAPFAPFFTVAGMSIMPKHKLWKYAKKGTIESFLSNGANPVDVVGSGPFMLDKIELGQRIVLKRNPNYWRKDSAGNRLPYLDKLILLIIKEPNVQILKFKNGELDFVVLKGTHYPILKPLEKQKDFKIYNGGPYWNESFFVFNQNNQKNPKTGGYYLDPVKQKWFRNKNFRQACAYAVNYKDIINIAYNGLASPPEGVWGKQKGFFNNPAAKKYTYNPQKAESLLNEIGFIDRDGDGFLEDMDGNRIEFTLSTTAGVTRIKEIFEMVRKDLENIGFMVHLSFVEFNNLMEKVTNTYNWDAVAYGLGGIMDPHFGKSTVISSSFRYIINPKQPRPSCDWEARIDEIFETAVSEMDSLKRKALYDEWQDISAEQALKVYLPISHVLAGASNRVQNIHIHKNLGLEDFLFWNIEEIFLIQ
ncbi:MAG: ABC transporter substrate-binding protein [bacterium]